MGFLRDGEDLDQAFARVKREAIGAAANLINNSGGASHLVYTALLTQSGNSDLQNISNIDLTVGVTYKIRDNSGADFTNVGAPNNDLDTFFVATGTTPTSWGDGIVQYNVGAPIAIVLENTLGGIVTYMYDYAGYYLINSDGLFTENKSFIIFSGVGAQFWIDNSTFSINAGDNNQLDNYPIKIVVYP